MKNSVIVAVSLLILPFTSCNEKKAVAKPKKVAPVRVHPKEVSYKMENTKLWLEKNGADNTKLALVFTINRTDKPNLTKMDSIIIPSDLTGDIAFYQPFPLEVPYLNDVNKIIYFSYATQTFAAYENGILIYTGATNMGRKKDPTPTGLFFTNWKAEKTTSTVNDEWELKWNFNIQNKLGIGFHEYELPGYPASHSCLRLIEKDAKFLYNWADQWVLSNKETTVKVKGTPVIVFGSYSFDSAKPWLELVKNSKILDISTNDIEAQTKPYLTKILTAQTTRATFEGKATE